MTDSISQIIMLLLGLGLVFFGLPLFRGALNIFGLIIGVVFGLFFFSLFVGALSLSPILVLCIAAAIALVGGMLGMALANFANTVFVFLAGGVVGLLISKLVLGTQVEDAAQTFQAARFFASLSLQPVDAVWFLIGGIVFVLAIDTVMTIALVVLGTAFIYHAVEPLHIMEPAWVIPVGFGMLGLLVQESLRHRAMRHERVIVIKHKTHEGH